MTTTDGVKTGTRVALVTGASTGLGLEVAFQLAGEGLLVLLSARAPERAAAAAARFAGGAGPGEVRPLSVGLDIADPASVARAADAIATDPGRLDVLVNNAAAYVDPSETVAGADLDAVRSVLETNLLGAWRTTAALLPLLQRSPAPRVVNVGSGAGSHGDPAFGLTTGRGGGASYAVSKAALHALTTRLAQEAQGTPMLVNAVCPGFTATFEGAESMGARPVSQSAPGVVWAATLPESGPSGGLFRDREPLPW